MWKRTAVRTFGVCLQQSSLKVTWSYTWNLTLRLRFSVLNELRPVCLFGCKYQPCLQTVGSLIWGDEHPLNKDTLSRLCSSRARWSLAPNLCSCVNRKSHSFFSYKSYAGQPRFYRFRELDSFQCSLEHSLVDHYSQLALFPGKKALKFSLN